MLPSRQSPASARPPILRQTKSQTIRAHTCSKVPKWPPHNWQNKTTNTRPPQYSRHTKYMQPGTCTHLRLKHAHPRAPSKYQWESPQNESPCRLKTGTSPYKPPLHKPPHQYSDKTPGQTYSDPSHTSSHTHLGHRPYCNNPKQYLSVQSVMKQPFKRPQNKYKLHPPSPSLPSTKSPWDTRNLPDN